jgi:putative phage-type endonuclease
MIEMIENHSDWIKARKRGIGGSDSGAVLGVNKYKSNVQLWEEKTGRQEPADLSNNAAVQFGKFAEPHLRELFKQDYPEYTVDYHEFWIYRHPEYDWLFATLDGELIAPDGSRGILEIKTTTIQNKSQWDEWDGRIPDSYYAQCLHQLAATGWDFVILKAYIRYHVDGEVRVTIRHYKINRKDVQSDINYLIARETAFWNNVQNDEMPALILPAI